MQAAREVIAVIVAATVVAVVNIFLRVDNTTYWKKEVMATINLNGSPKAQEKTPSGAIEMQPISNAPASQGTQGLIPGFIAKAGHPWVAFFHVIFKVVAIFCYLLLFWLTQWYILSFILTTSLLAVDFWVTKNVSGRILAGLRWWSFIKEDGSSEWMFESLPKEQQGRLNETDIWVFWNSIYVFSAFWVLISVFNLLTLHFNNLVLCVIGMTFSISNWMGYSKCSKDAKNSARTWAGLQAVKILTRG